MSLNIPNDSYVSLDEANDYHRLRESAEMWDGLDDATKRRRLVSSSDFLDHYYRFRGEKANIDQSRQFPRKGSQIIPNAVKSAVCELALQTGLNQNQALAMSSVKVGPVAVSYAIPDAQTANRFEYVKGLLNGLLDTPKGYTPLVRG